MIKNYFYSLNKRPAMNKSFALYLKGINMSEATFLFFKCPKKSSKRKWLNPRCKLSSPTRRYRIIRQMIRILLRLNIFKFLFRMIKTFFHRDDILNA
jgi:hypothetical protein